MTTTTDYNDAESDRIIAEGLSAAERMREHIKAIERARDEQPAKLAVARTEAEKARDWAQIEEPWADQITSLLPDSGDPARALTLPNMTAKEVAGARLAFDLLDAGEDGDRENEILSQVFSMVDGDTGQAMLIMSAALTTITGIVVPQLLDALEHDASDYTTRVKLAEACANAWNERISVLRLQRNQIIPDGEPSLEDIENAEDEQ